MADIEKKTYRLFALPMNTATEQHAQEYRFCRITPFYSLVYTESEEPQNSVEIAGADLERLSSADRDWLLGCNITLLAEDAQKREKEISESISEKIEMLENALKEAKQGLVKQEER